MPQALYPTAFGVPKTLRYTGTENQISYLLLYQSHIKAMKTKEAEIIPPLVK
jgi:hypothetical protein